MKRMRHQPIKTRYKNFTWPLLIVLFVMSAISGCKGFGHLTRVEMAYPKASFCEDCHGDVCREWADSPHARAFTSNTFRMATHDYSFTDCLGCHAPEPALSVTQAECRTIFREEGVTCASCHLEESKMVGPLTPTGILAPHPVRVDDGRYRNSQFCGRCHEGTFKEWSDVKAENKHTCQDCHMPPVKRRITQSDKLISKMIVATEEVTAQKKHTFGIYQKLPDVDPFHVTVNRDGALFTVVLENNVPHALPTGDFGIRIVTVDISAVQANDEVVPIKRLELIKGLHTAIPPKCSASWTFSLPDTAKAVRCVISRCRVNSDEREELYQTEVPVI
ncbi:MAG: hypothetical protein HZB37_04505 [Planctomycetes bacterium]|nr:hypothetical protein [Planctomycetota bacterium]